MEQLVTASDSLQELLLTFKQSIGVLVGWYGETGIFCVGCCAQPDLIPSGLQAVGAFCVTDDDVTDKEAVSMCQEILRQQWESCPEEDEAVILYLSTSKDTLKRSVSPIIYSLEFGNIQSAELLVRELESMYLNHILLRAKGCVPLVFEESPSEESLHQSVEKLRSALSGGLVALHLMDSSILLAHDNSQSLTVRDLVKAADSEKQTSKSKASKIRKGLRERDVLKFNILLQSTNITSAEDENHTPLIKYQRSKFKSVAIPLAFDVVALQQLDASASDAYHALTASLSNQLAAFLGCLLSFKNKNHYEVPEAYTFWPSCLGFPVTVSYPKDLDDSQLGSVRKEFHHDLLITLDRPVLRKLNRLELSDDLARIPYLRNTHLGLVQDVSAQGYKQAIVYGTYTYHHYMQDRIDDNGWGCAYRSLQTIVSWFRHQGYTDKPVPTHKDIQQALVDIGDKPSSFAGSNKWIGSQEVSFCLDHLIGVISKTMFVSSGADLSNKGRELLSHFENQGTPIMIGGGVLAHTIIGVKYNDITGDIEYLILDPHYTGAEDLHIIQNKEWCGWKGPQFWDKTAFYNLCLPQRPTTF